ncbi:hypothetical protein O3S80_31625 [Streptomyces sp. Lzd4kr]|nr:hypothetical protein [Streptomyces sp. Lzd4kr]
MTVLVAAAAGAIHWQRSARDLTVTGVTVRTSHAKISCGAGVNVVADVSTNGESGVIRYRWIRSDGTTSAALRQSVRSEQRKVELPMTWTFSGRGTQRASAVIDILSPDSLTATTTFTYDCHS